MEKERREELLGELGRDQGMNLEEMLDHFGLDSIVPGICTECMLVSDQCEPDMRDGHCEGCGKQKVKSCMVLARVI